MDFNIKTEFKESPFKVISLILVGVIFIIMIWATISSSGENRRLKNDIKENLEKIEELEEIKKPIFEELKADSLAIKKRDSVILVLSNEKNNLLRTLKYYKNENFKLKNTYVNAPLNERIKLFSRLATEKDTIQRN